MFKVSGVNYRTQNDFRFAIVSADDLEFGPIHCTKSLRNNGFLQGSATLLLGELFKAMWIAIPKVSLRILNLNPECLKLVTSITVPRTSFDLLLSPQTILNSAQSFVLSKGEIADFYRALQPCFWRAFPGDVDCDTEVFISNPESKS